jgi:hypothetical protein
MPASMTIDQDGIAAGVANEAREDGLDTGALVTLTSNGHVDTFEFSLLWVGQHPSPDTTSISSLSHPGGAVATFEPTSGVYGSWRIRLITDAGTPFEDEQILIFAIVQPGGIRIPAANEQSSKDANIANVASHLADCEFNAPEGDGPFGSGTAVAHWRPVADLIYQWNADGGGGAFSETTTNNSTPNPGELTVLDEDTLITMPAGVDGSLIGIAIAENNVKATFDGVQIDAGPNTTYPFEMCHRESAVLVYSADMESWIVVARYAPQQATVVNDAGGVYVFTLQDLRRFTIFDEPLLVMIDSDANVKWPENAVIRFASLSGFMGVGFTGGASVTGPPGMNLEPRAPGSIMELHKIAVDTWLLVGDLSVAA